MYIDESGQDHQASPYEVLAGLVVRDVDLWPLIQQIQQIELDCFGDHYRKFGTEIKSVKFIKKKTFRLANQMPPIEIPKRTQLAKQALQNGAAATRDQLTALAQAKLDYVARVLQLAKAHKCYAFATIIKDPSTLPSEPHKLRKDYVFLFERFFYYLQDRKPIESGMIVFDELEKSQSHILLSQMDNYFKKTHLGRERSSLIIPEPFFVHSDLTTGIQLADFIAYIVSWAFRITKLTKPKRDELDDLMHHVAKLRYLTSRIISTQNIDIWSFSVV